MTGNHESGCLPCGWLWKRKDKVEAAARSPSSAQLKGLNAENLRKTASIEQPITGKETTITEVYLSTTSEEAKLVKDKDVPSDIEYAMEATKKALTVLKGIADIVKFPLVKEVIELGVSILDTCQSISDVQSGVHRLKERITCLLFCIVDSTKEAEESDRLVKDLENLKECLFKIMRRLEAIASQNTFKSSYLSEPNMKIISECEKDFQDSVDRFQTLRTLEMGQNIALIQRQVATFYGISLDMADNVETIKHEVTDIKSMLIQAGLKSSKTTGASTRIPQLTSPIFGREEVVQRITEQLAESGGSRVCILGPGGMGKTSTALAVMNHTITQATFGEERYWVPCIQANSFDNFIAILFKHVKAQSRTGDPLEDVIATLQEAGKRRIILLDNFETPWRGIPDAEHTIKPILSDLDSIPNISILLTMRSEWAPLSTWHCMKLDPIKPEESQALYTSIHADAADYPDQLKTLVDALGHMPYAITLMASRGQKSGADPEKLLHEWKTRGTDMLSKKAEGINRCIELSIESEYVRAAGDASRILQILSMLPAGVMQEDLSIWAGEWTSEAIETLREAALIVSRPIQKGGNRTTRHHLVLPVVQSYMAQKDRIPPEVRMAVFGACYEFLRRNNATVKGPNDPLFPNHLAAIAGQEANLQALITEALKEHRHTDVSRSDHLDALLAYTYYQRWMKPRPELAEKIVAFAQEAATPHYEATALFCLGHILNALTRYPEASQAFKQAQAIFEGMGEQLMTLESELMQLDIDDSQGNYDSAWMRFNTIQSSWADAASVNPTFSALISYYHGSLQFYGNGDSPKALDILQEVVGGFEADGRPYETAYCLFLMARCHAHLQSFPDALQVLDASIKLSSSIFGRELNFKTPETMYAFILRARYLKASGCWDDEMETTLRVTLELSRELGLSRCVGQCLLEFGEIYVQRGEFEAAQDAYREIVRKGYNMDDPTAVDIVRQAEQNLQYLDHLFAISQGSETVEVKFRLPHRA